jgi:hypothetical protein
MTKTLSSLLVSRDSQEISVLECILSGLHIAVDVETEPSRAFAKLAKSKIDALIVDTDLEKSRDFLRAWQKGLVRNSVPIVILSAPTPRKSPETREAAFIFKKPISVEQAVHILSGAYSQILEGRLRYHRQPIDIPIRISSGAEHAEARIINLSQGGAGIHTDKPLQFEDPLELSFTLPGSKSVLRLEGELTWSNPEGNAGIRFVEPGPKIHRSLQLWVEQQFFAK